MSTIEINGVQLYYEIKGSGSETIVFLSGFGLGMLQFEEVANRLASDYCCVLFDHRCQGKSQMLDVPFIGTETVYEDAVAVVNQLGNPPCHLVGLSMGGWTGMRIAARQPDLVRSLIVMGTGAEEEEGGGVDIEQHHDSLRDEGMTPENVEKSLFLFFGEHMRTHPSRSADLQKWREIVSGFDPRLHAVGRSLTSRLGIEYEIRHITAPTLVVGGAQDLFFTPDTHRRISEAIPGSRLAIIPECGHTPPIEQPAEVYRLIKDFLHSSVAEAPSATDEPASQP